MSGAAPIDPRTGRPALNPYGEYTPSLPTAAVFIAIFSLSSLVYLYQILKPKPKRMLWMLVFPICGLIEIIGWAGRLWSHFNVYGDGFMQQICCLTIAPTFMSAGLYMLLGVLIQRIAPHTSILSGKAFKITFLVADILSLVIQAIGGGMAASATTASGTEKGGQIMLGGIAFQLFVMIVYVVYGAIWAHKSRTEIHGTILSIDGGEGITRAVAGMALCSLFIIIRGFYRSVELGDGFKGEIATNEPLFLLDAIPVALAMISLNVLPPIQHLRCLGDNTKPSARRSSKNMIDLGLQNGEAERSGSPTTLVGSGPSKK
ncbi:RTA1 like protein-domain-containing protein [Leucosporidium creatinivorum]|uniref:RTA1 like protein-domain-containing protein n=1 Tax=Leucosporidium creatinivorum TaxID=106004 RepID=A0A1Y2CMC1_9BASI|nr:RTA1 like protein-domain-containing protein [Leucosporidium creatinivorum]